MISTLLQIDEKTLDKICREYRVKKLSIFGSVVSGEARPDSDVDVLVEYDSEFSPTFFAMTDLSEALRPIFGGREVDLVIPEELHWLIRDDVLKSARVIYER